MLEHREDDGDGYKCSRDLSDFIYIWLCVCHPRWSPSSCRTVSFLTAVDSASIFCEEKREKKDVTANIWLSLSIHIWLLTGPCAVVIVREGEGKDGWDLQFPLPGNVSCCETMWQKISTSVMAQQCSLPLYILLQELIQSSPQMYCM